MYRVRGNLTLEKIVAGIDEDGLYAFDLAKRKSRNYLLHVLNISIPVFHCRSSL